MFANYVELSEDLKEGVITNIRLLLTDRSRAAAAVGRRTGGNRTELDKGVFSPCDLCEDDPTRAPLWQLKAVKIIHDQETKTIEYQDAWMEIYGIRSEEHTSELQSLMRISYAVFCLKKKKQKYNYHTINLHHYNN